MTENPSTSTTITNIDIPFGRLVVIMLKMMCAALPAIVLFYFLLIVFSNMGFKTHEPVVPARPNPAPSVR